MENIKLIDDWLDTAQLVCPKTDGRTKYDFSNFTFPSKFTLKMFRRELDTTDMPELECEESAA